MCLFVGDGLFGASSGVTDQGLHTLRMMAIDLWDSVSRIADGHQPDAMDLRVLAGMATALRGQAASIKFVEKEAAGAAPQSTAPAQDTLVDLLWQAATQLGVRHLLRNEPVEGLTYLAERLDAVATGDKETAATYDRLVERLAGLAEQTTGDAEARVAV